MAPSLLAVAAAPALAGSPPAFAALGSLSTGNLDLSAGIETFVRFGIVVPDGSTVRAGTVFQYTVSVTNQASDEGFPATPGMPTAIPFDGPLSATGTVTQGGTSTDPNGHTVVTYTYTVVVNADYTNTSGSTLFFNGGLQWAGGNLLGVGAEVTTGESGSVIVDTGDTTYYSAY